MMNLGLRDLPSTPNEKRTGRCFSVALLFVACILPGQVWADSLNDKPWTWKLDFGRVPETVSEAQVDEWAKQALAGDMKLKRQFARASLGCWAIEFKERCEAMGKYRELGQKFLKEIIDLVPPMDDKREQRDIGQFQSYYANRQFDAAMPNFDPESEACQQGLKYAVSAIENGANCISLTLRKYFHLGRCMEKNDPRYAPYINQVQGCTIR